MAVDGWAAFLHAVCVIIDKDRSGARVWDRLKGNVAPFEYVEMNESRESEKEREKAKESVYGRER